MKISLGNGSFRYFAFPVVSRESRVCGVDVVVEEGFRFIFQLPRDRVHVIDRMIEIVCTCSHSHRGDGQRTALSEGHTASARLDSLIAGRSRCRSHQTIPRHYSPHTVSRSLARARTSRLLASHHSSRDGRTRVPRSIASTTSRPTEDVGGTVYTRRGHTESSPWNKSNEGSLWDTHHEVQHDGSFSALRLRALARLASPSSAFFS